MINTLLPIKELRPQFEKLFDNLDITESATGDHYVELGDEAGPRSFGKRTVGGIMIM